MTLRPFIALLLAAVLAPAARAQEETAGNNLSYPAVFTGARSALAGTPGFPVLGGTTLGVDLSYGCAIPDTSTSTTYPNTSCYDATSNTFFAADDPRCLAMCAGASSIDPIYWQQSTTNSWQAGSLAEQGKVQSAAVDWGDNLETVTWSERSIVRVETTPFTALPTALEPETATLTGYQMWHVANQGPDEMWGVHADAGANPYTYENAYAIVNTPARLNIAKIGGDAPCNAASPYAGALTWGWATDGAGELTGLGSWSGAGVTVAQADDLLYTVELNIGGKFVYGYNWNLKKAPIPAVPGTVLGKTGWWRLTFYTGPTPTIDFVEGLQFAPPPNATNPEALYAPGADPSADRELTFIDICIGKTRGGGRGGGGSGG